MKMIILISTYLAIAACGVLCTISINGSPEGSLSKRFREFPECELNSLAHKRGAQSTYKALLAEVTAALIAGEARGKGPLQPNQVRLYHLIGLKIVTIIKTLFWGAKIVYHLARDLKKVFPDRRDLDVRNLSYMAKFARLHPELELVESVARFLTWGHVITILLTVNGKKDQIFYMQKSLEWALSRRELLRFIASQGHTKAYRVCS